MLGLSLFKPKKKESSGVFIPDGIGRFKELTVGPVKGSINELSFYLGYDPDQIFAYHSIAGMNYIGIHSIIVEVFTDNIIFILTHKQVNELTDKAVKSILNEFRSAKVYSNAAVKDILEIGAENESLTVDFLTKVLNLCDTAPNGVFNAPSIGYYLYFNNGVLTDFQPQDGFNQWAKDWKLYNPIMFEQYALDAEIQYGVNPTKITHAINVQADAFAGTPNGFKNEFLALHKGDQELVNFKMLMVCHYGNTINLDEFKFVNQGRYRIEKDFDKKRLDRSTYIAGRFRYIFDEKGKLFSYTLIG